MSQPNPYQPIDQGASAASGLAEVQIRRVSVHPIELMKRAYALMGDQYMLMVGVTVVAVILGSLVPLGLIMGALMVGIYFCFMQREQFGRTEFGAVFKGFDFFLDSFLVILMSVALSLVVLLPLYVLMMVTMVAAMAGAQGNEQATVLTMLVIMPAFMFVMIAASMVVYLPFLFSFQLIADRHLTAIEAVKVSWRGVWMNLGGVVWHLIVIAFASMLAAMMCYIPALFLLPITLGSLFILYRDIYGPGSYGPPPLSQPITAMSPLYAGPSGAGSGSGGS